MDHPAFQSTQTPIPPAPDAAISPSQPTKPSNKNLKKWIIIVGALLVALLTGSAYILSQQNSQKSEVKTVTQPTVARTSPTPDPTADWKTLINAKYNFSLKYPPTWKYLEVPNPTYITSSDEIWLTDEYSPFPRPQTDSRAKVVIRILRDDPLPNWQRPQAYDDYKEEQIMLGIVPATKISGIYKISTLKESIVVAKINSLYLLALLSSSDPETTKNFDQILSTFKFTQPTILSCTPRDACLDADPPCMMPESDNMCPKTTFCPTAPVCKEGEQLVHGDPGPDSEIKCPIYSCVKRDSTNIN